MRIADNSAANGSIYRVIKNTKHIMVRSKQRAELGRALLLLLLMGLFSQVALAAGEKADVRLVIDVSGSMKRNDSQNLRQPAVDLLVRLLPKDSRAGVWTFGKYVNMLVPHKDVDEPWRQLAKEKAPEINSVALFTNIGEALEKATLGMGSSGDEFKKSIILLTDGMVDIDKDPKVNQAEWRRIVDEVLPKIKQAGITLHTVALSEHADSNLLEKLALATDGTAAVARTADDLMQVFLKAFDVAAPAQQVPLKDNGFAVDSSVEEFTALIFREQADENTQLIGPDQSVYDSASKDADVRWFRSKDYDLITVQKPLEGEWKIRAAIAPESRITVVSDLQLRVKTLPNNVFKGAQENLNFVLQEGGKTIESKDFLLLLTNTVNLGFGPEETIVKQVWSHDFSQFAPPANGVYNAPLPLLREMGTYELSLLIDGKTFQRRFAHRITVREPFTAELTEQVDANGLMQKLLTVRSHSDNIDPKNTQVAAVVINPQRRKSVKPLGFTEQDTWQTLIHLDQPGTYSVTVQISGQDLRKEAFEYVLEPINIANNPDATFAEAPEKPSSAAPVTEEKLPEPTATPKPVEPKPEPKPEPVAEEPPVDEVPEEAPSAGVPKWLLYVILALGNLLVLGGGFFLFKKLMSDSSEDVLEELAEQEPPPTPEPVAAPKPEPVKVDQIAMDLGDSDEEEPPMEDLDPVEMGAGSSDEPASGMEDDFGVDDIEEEPVVEAEEVSTEDEAADEEASDLAAEMLKAQGLDLAEDELDDAITNLIDELDGGEKEPAKPKPNVSDFDDFDFDDEDDEDLK